MHLVKGFLSTLETLHKDSRIKGGANKSWDRRPAVVLMIAALCLLILQYAKYDTSFNAMLGHWFSFFSDSPSLEMGSLKTQTFFPLVTQAWWTFWHVITFIVIPVIVIKFFLRDSLNDYGIGMGKLSKHFKWYLLLVAPILCFVVIVSFRDDFSSHYPFYKFAHRSWFDLIAWEVLYLLQFVCVEFFFRGFIIQGCRPSFGVNAIFVMIVPYLMLHFQKPWLEASGAIFFGLFLGMLAFHSRTIWGGVLVHISIALSMDIAALIQTKGLPQQWFP